MKMPLFNYVNLLRGLGKTIRQIWESIKTKVGYKNTTNNVIQETIKNVDAMRDAASRINDYQDTTKINIRKSKVPNGNRVEWEVEYTFTYESSGHSKLRGFTIRVSSNLSKGEMMDLIKEDIRDWLMGNYGRDNLRGIANTIRITAMRGVGDF